MADSQKNCDKMLRRDIRFFVFIGSLILLIIALYQFRSSREHKPKRFSPSMLELKPEDHSPQGQGRNLNSVEIAKLVPNIQRNTLRDYTVQDVRRFLFFVGYARSGHSIIASILDAHPHIVISHEYSLFNKWEEDPVNHSDKSWLFTTLFQSSRENADGGLRQSTKKGYSLAVPGWWQGKYDGYIDIIGDKSGGLTAQVFRRSKENFKSLYQQLRNTVQVPIVVIHALRNPYDNIATMLLYNYHKKSEVNETHKYDNADALREKITSYFHQVQSVVRMIKEVPLDAIEVHSRDLIANPKQQMRSLCTKLQIECSDEYLHMCAKTVYVSESKSRNLVVWTPELIEMVAEHIKSYKQLQRYSFYS